MAEREGARWNYKRARLSTIPTGPRMEFARALLGIYLNLQSPLAVSACLPLAAFFQFLVIFSRANK